MADATPPESSGSRPGTRPINSRLTSSATRGSTSRTRSFIHPGPENLILSEAQIGGEEAALLHDLVHPHEHTAEATLVETDGHGAAEEDYQELDRLDTLKKPWYRRPSAWWLLCLIPFTSIAMSATIAPRVEMYTYLVCREHRGYKESNGPASMVWPMMETPHLSAEPATQVSGNSLDLNTVFEPSRFFQNSFDDDDDPESQPCASDPEVQADVAKLIATMTSLMGILSCITTTWWGSFSDRNGRVRLMGIAIFGLLYSDLNFIMVSNFAHKLRGGYWFLILGPMVEGFFGGLPTAVATMHAYIADCAEPSARSRLFSLQVGLLFVGMAVGPTLGGLLVRLTHGVLSPLNNVLSVFYGAAGIHILYALMLWFVVPESLGERARAVCREERKRGREEAAAKERREAEEFARDTDGSHWGAIVFKFLLRVKRVSTFFSPLHVFLPVEVDTKTQVPGESNLKIRPKKDWNLTIFAVGFGFYQMIMGSYQYKFQYAAGAFSWTSEELGYFLSVVGSVRAIYLTILLPLVIKLLQRRRPAIQLPIETDEPLNASEGPVEGPSSSADANVTTTPLKPSVRKIVPFNALKFDLNLARISLFLEIICYSAIPLTSSPIMFVVLSLFISLGAGFGPAVQSVALELFNSRRREAGGSTAGNENGRLFGALSFLQALCAQIIGPALFGITYMETVKTYPAAIFFTSAGVAFCTFTSMCFIRLPKRNLTGIVTPTIIVEEVIINEDLETGSIQRGRQPRLDRNVTLVDVSDS